MCACVPVLNQTRGPGPAQTTPMTHLSAHRAHRLRMVRVFRVARTFHDLRIMLNGIMVSMRSLMWALVLLFFLGHLGPSRRQRAAPASLTGASMHALTVGVFTQAR